MKRIALDGIDQEAWEQFLESVGSVSGKQWLVALAALFVLLVISHFLVRLLVKRLDRSTRISKSLHTVLVSLIRFLFVLLSVMLAGNLVGISISSFLVIFGVLGAAVALAAQGVLNNIAGCIIVLSGRLFEVEDYIETPTGAGTVKEINLLNTKLLDYDGNTIFIPNSVLYTETVTNVTAYKKRRIVLKFRASQAHAPKDVREAVFDAFSHFPKILDDPAPAMVVGGYTAGHVVYTVLAWVNAEDYWPVRLGLCEQFYDSLKEHGISMTDKGVSIVVADPM